MEPDNLKSSEACTSLIENGVMKLLIDAQHIKKHIEDFSSIKVVLGNVTCDMDSAACALSYAFLLYTEYVKSGVLRDKAVVPMFNIFRSELKLKTEVVYLLKKLGIPQHLIITRNDIILVELARENKLELVLVDHHVLEEKDQVLKESVVQIIDHRPQVGNWVIPVPRIMCTIEQVGSCSSLVAQKILDREPDIFQNHINISHLLYAAILLDTVNFSEACNRFSDLDLHIVEHLENYILKNGASRIETFKELLSARSNVDHLTASECLKKDMKLGGGNPVCTLPMLIQEFCTRPDAESALHNLVTSSEKYEIVVLIGVDTIEDETRRDVGFFTISAVELQEKVQQSLENADDLKLALKRVAQSPEIPGLDIYEQLNVQCTRKHMLPIIDQAIKYFIRPLVMVD